MIMTNKHYKIFWNFALTLHRFDKRLKPHTYSDHGVEMFCYKYLVK